MDQQEAVSQQPQRDRGLFLYLHYIGGRRAFRSINDIKGNSCTFIQRFKTISLDCAVVNKDIVSTVLCDKTESFCIVKPFNCSFCHLYFLLIFFWGFSSIPSL